MGTHPQTHLLDPSPCRDRERSHEQSLWEEEEEEETAGELEGTGEKSSEAEDRGPEGAVTGEGNIDNGERGMDGGALQALGSATRPRWHVPVSPDKRVVFMRPAPGRHSQLQGD